METQPTSTVDNRRLGEVIVVGGGGQAGLAMGYFLTL
jgi:hypothetical protein